MLNVSHPPGHYHGLFDDVPNSALLRSGEPPFVSPAAELCFAYCGVASTWFDYEGDLPMCKKCESIREKTS